MLKLLRKNRKSLLGLVIVGFVCLLMVSFGLDFYNGPQSRTEAITVNGKEISYREYSRRLSQLQNVLRRQFGENYAQIQSMLNLPQRTVDDLINSELINKFIVDLGLSASSSQIEARIAAYPDFGGTVTKTAYDAFLRSKGLSGSQLEEMTRQEIVMEQLRTMFSDLSAPTDEELKQAYLDENRQAAFSYLTFAPEKFRNKVDISAEEPLKNFYAEHAEKYRTPRKVQYVAIEFSPAEFIQTVDLQEDDVLEAYQQRKHLFTEPARIHLRRIFIAKKNKPSEVEKLVTGGQPAPDAEKNDAGREAAENALARLDSGEAFSEVAKAISEDKETAGKGGDMGVLLYSDLKESLREAAAELGEGEHSQIITADDGYYLLFAEKKTEKRIKDLSEVRAELEQELRQSDAPQYAQAAAAAFKAEWEKKRLAATEITLADFAKEKGRKVIESGRALAPGEAASPGTPAITAHALTLRETEVGLFDEGEASYLIEAIKVEASRVPDFKDVAEQVKEAYINEKSASLAKKAAEEALLALGGKQDKETEAKKTTLESLAAAHGVAVEKTDLAARGSSSGPLFMVPGAQQALFSTSEAHPVVNKVLQSGNTFYLAVLTQTKLPDLAEFEAKKKEVEAREVAKSSRRLMDSLMTSLRTQSDIWVNPELLEKQS